MAKVSISTLRRIIREEADIIINYDDASELEPRIDAWSGGDNLTLSIDHSKAGGSEEVTDSPETLSIVDDAGVYRMTESKLREMVKEILKAR